MVRQVVPCRHLAKPEALAKLRHSVLGARKVASRISAESFSKHLKTSQNSNPYPSSLPVVHATCFPINNGCCAEGPSKDTQSKSTKPVSKPIYHIMRGLRLQVSFFRASIALVTGVRLRGVLLPLCIWPRHPNNCTNTCSSFAN